MKLLAAIRDGDSGKCTDLREKWREFERRDAKEQAREDERRAKQAERERRAEERPRGDRHGSKGQDAIKGSGDALRL